MALKIPGLPNIFNREMNLKVKGKILDFLGNRLLTQTVANLIFPNVVTIKKKGELPEVLENNEIVLSDDFSGDSILNINPLFWETLELGTGVLSMQNSSIKCLVEHQGASQDAAGITAYQKSILINYKNINWIEMNGKFRYSNPDGVNEQLIGLCVCKYANWYQAIEGVWLEGKDNNTWKCKSDNGEFGEDDESAAFTIEQNKWHTFKIRFSSGSCRFWVDDVFIDTLYTDLTNQEELENFMFVLARTQDSPTGESYIECDWLSLLLK